MDNETDFLPVATLNKRTKTIKQKKSAGLNILIQSVTVCTLKVGLKSANNCKTQGIARFPIGGGKSMSFNKTNPPRKKTIFKIQKCDIINYLVAMRTR